LRRIVAKKKLNKKINGKPTDSCEKLETNQAGYLTVNVGCGVNLLLRRITI
jgi:hypothetical protein